MDHPRLRFDLSNVGNTDIELLMLEVLIPFGVLEKNTHSGDGVEVSATQQNGRVTGGLGATLHVVSMAAGGRYCARC
jgi:hypothetical protein